MLCRVVMAKLKRMADCHPDRPHQAKGLCAPCYKKAWYIKQGKHKPLVAKTPECHSTRKHQAKGLCQQCYSAQYYMENADRIIQSVGIWTMSNPTTCAKNYTRRRSNKFSRIKQLVSNAKRRASEKNLNFDLDFDYLLSIWNDTCPILGIPILIEANTGKNRSTGPTVDRIDNSKGYVKHNVQII